MVPLGTTARVTTTQNDILTGQHWPMKFSFVADGSKPTSTRQIGIANTTGNLMDTNGSFSSASNSLYPSNLQADLTSATAASRAIIKY